MRFIKKVYLCPFVLTLRMRKRLIIFMLCFTVALPIVAQVQSRSPLFFTRYEYEKRWHFGFSLGLNMYDFYVKNSLDPQVLPQEVNPTVLRSVINSPLPGFNLQGIIDFRLSSDFNVRALPGLSLGTRELSFFKANEDNEFTDLVYAMKFDSYYVELPVLIKYSATRNSNVRPYMILGGNLRINLNSSTAEKKGVYFALKPVEPFIEIGIGLDQYFYYFKFGMELIYSYGLANLISRGGNFVQIPGYEAYGNAIHKMFSQMLTLAFNFE